MTANEQPQPSRENRYFRYDLISGSVFTHVLYDKKTAKRWLVHATGVRFPFEGDVATVWFPVHYNPYTLEAIRWS